MPDNPNQSRRANGEYGPAIYPKDKPEIQIKSESVSDFAQIGVGVRIMQSNIGDATIEDGANLINTSFVRTKLTGVNLSWADLRGADFTDADLSGAIFAEVTFDHRTVWPEGFDTSRLKA